MKAFPETLADKMFNILVAINDAYSMTAKGAPVILSPNIKPLQHIPLVEIESFLNKLYFEEKVIVIARAPAKVSPFRFTEAKPEECYGIIIMPEFKEYFEKTIPAKQPDMQDLIKLKTHNLYNAELQRTKNNIVKHDVTMDDLLKKQQEVTHNVPAYNGKKNDDTSAANTNTANDRLLWIEFDKINQRVVLNDIIILSEPKPDSDAWKLISKLTEEPNKPHKKANVCLGHVSNAYRDLGLQKGLKDLFLEVGKETIKLINPVTRERFESLEKKEPVRVYFKEKKEKTLETAA